MACSLTIPSGVSLTATSMADALFAGTTYFVNNIAENSVDKLAAKVAGGGFGVLLTAASVLHESTDGTSFAKSLSANALGAAAGIAAGSIIGGSTLGATVLGFAVGAGSSILVASAASCLFDDPLNTPLVMDLNNNGLDLTSLSSSTAMYNLLNNDFSVRTGWVESTDGFLAIDLDSNGHITDSSELFGGNNNTGFNDGFEALSHYDLTANGGNGDGKIDSNDQAFNDLLVWQDLNQNGFSETNELQSLSHHNITSISLNDSVSNQTVEGHHVSSTASFIKNGQTQQISDVWFEYDHFNAVSMFNDNFVFDTDALDLTNLRGHGYVRDLQIAMSEDSVLLNMVENIEGSNFQNFNFSQFSSQVEDMLFRWAGVDNVNPTSRGSFIDGRVMEAWEEFLGREYTASGGDPNSNTGKALTVEWSNFVVEQAAKMLVGIVYSPVQDALRIVLDEIQTEIASGTEPGDVSIGFYVTRLSQEFSNVDNAVTSHPLYDFVETLAVDFWQDKIVSVSGNSVADFNDFIDNIDGLEPTISSDVNEYWQDKLPLINMVTGDLDVSYAEYLTAMQGTYLESMSTEIYGKTLRIGSDGDDVLSDSSPNNGLSVEAFIGGEGDDTLEGGVRNDNYIFESGDGDDVVRDSSISGNDSKFDKLFFADADSTSVTLSRVGTNGEDVVVHYGNSDSVTVEDMFHGGNGFFEVELFEFADGVIWGVQDVINITTASTSGSDTIWGTNYADTIDGGAGNDTIYGLNGSDLIAGGTGNDTIYHNGSGDETIDGGAGNDKLYGHIGNNFIRGGADIDIIDGHHGNDTLDGGSGKDILTGGVGADVFVFSFFSHSIRSGSNYDRITDFEIGVDKIDVTALNIAGVGLGVYTPGILRIHYSIGNDRTYVRENYGSDFEFYLEGNYTKSVANGGMGILSDSDFNFQVPAYNLIHGTAASDQIGGTLGNDSILGFASSDKIYGHAGNDTLYGGASQTDTNDTHDTIYGGDGGDFIFDYAGNDVLYGGSQGDVIHAGIGNDTLYGGNDSVDTADHADLLYGQDDNDVIYGSGGNDTLDGGNHDDQLYGGTGGDFLYGQSGNDLLYGGAEGDVVLGGVGDDTIYGGNDALDAADHTDALYGNDGNDVIYGSGGGDFLYGENGADLLYGGAQGDAIQGGTGNDTIYGGNDAIDALDHADALYGQDGNDVMYGSGGGDIMDGQNHNDQMYGGLGNDTLIGGAGTDNLTGDAGDDIFYIKAANQNDTIIDLQGGGIAGGDIIQLDSNMNGTQINTFAELMANSGSDGTHSWLGTGGGNGILVLYHTLSDFTSSDFNFV